MQAREELLSEHEKPEVEEDGIELEVFERKEEDEEGRKGEEGEEGEVSDEEGGLISRKAARKKT